MRDWRILRDVIGIDLGMALLSLKNHRSDLVWTLMDSFYATASAHRAAEFPLTLEPDPRPLHRTDVNPPIS